MVPGKFRNSWDTFYILFFFLGDLKYNEYWLKGTVEGVAYTRNRDWPCYVAVTEERFHPESNNFHASRNMMICTFAERAHALEKTVSMRGFKSDSPCPEVITLTWPDKEADLYTDSDLSDNGTFYGIVPHFSH